MRPMHLSDLWAIATGLGLFLLLLTSPSWTPVLWALIRRVTQFIMSRPNVPPLRKSVSEVVHVPVPPTSTDAGTTAAQPGGTAGSKPDTDAGNADTNGWEMPRISRHLSDHDIVTLLAVQVNSAGKQRFSANKIVELIGGSRADVLALVKTIREGPAEFRPLTPEQRAVRQSLGLNQREVGGCKH